MRGAFVAVNLFTCLVLVLLLAQQYAPKTPFGAQSITKEVLL